MRPGLGRPRVAVALLLAAHASPWAADPAPATTDASPHFEGRTVAGEYSGPGREEPPPSDLEEVRIGYFGPSDPEHPTGGDMWLAAELALDEANRRGGYRGLPFRLVSAWSENPWGSGVSQVARMVYEDRVWAIVGSVDGASTHLAEQVVAKARLALVSPAGTDASVNMANVPWTFSCLGADDLQAAVLWRELKRRVDGGSFILVSSTAHDWHHAATALADRVSREGSSPLLHLEFAPGARDLAPLVARVGDSGSRTVVILAGPLDSARLLAGLKRLPDPPSVFGGPSLGRRSFIESAGSTAEGAVFPLPCDPRFRSSRFAELFHERFGRPADCTAAQTYDAIRLIVEAIHEAGLNRALIRDAVAKETRWSGAAGSIEWNSLGQNRREPWPATIRDGVVVPLDRD